MNKLQKTLLFSLLGLNLILVGLLVHLNVSQAEAQMTPYPTSDYIVQTCQVGSDWDALIIVDLQSNRLAGWKWDKSRKRLAVIGGRDLARDLKISR
jgi:hypothetical protein